MTRRALTAFAAIAVVAATLGTGTAGAQELEVTQPENPKTVEESPSGSYIVVLEDEPVVAELGADNLDSAAADARSEELVESHDDVLDVADAEDGDKVQDYTIALNGFSAKLSYEEAVAVAAQTNVVMVLPDELHQITTDSSRKFLGLTELRRHAELGVRRARVQVRG
jgi:hypothetical protein